MQHDQKKKVGVFWLIPWCSRRCLVVLALAARNLGVSILLFDFCFYLCPCCYFPEDLVITTVFFILISIMFSVRCSQFLFFF